MRRRKSALILGDREHIIEEASVEDSENSFRMASSSKKPRSSSSDGKAKFKLSIVSQESQKVSGSRSSSKSVNTKKKRMNSKVTMNSTKLNEPSSTAMAKEGSSRLTSNRNSVDKRSGGNEQRDD